MESEFGASSDCRWYRKSALALVQERAYFLPQSSRVAGFADDSGPPPKYSNHLSAACLAELFNGEKYTSFDGRGILR